jgi:hypothetical protein
LVTQFSCCICYATRKWEKMRASATAAIVVVVLKEPHGTRIGSGVYERVGLSAIFASIGIVNPLNGPNIRPR